MHAERRAAADVRASRTKFERLAAAALLFAWGVFDQFHFFYSSKADDSAALHRAAEWNPDDSTVQTKLARLEMTNGESLVALESLRRAAEVNPENINLQEQYAQGLIAAGKIIEAYGIYQKALEKNPKFAQGWVNLGLLAGRLGRGAA